MLLSVTIADICAFQIVRGKIGWFMSKDQAKILIAKINIL